MRSSLVSRLEFLRPLALGLLLSTPIAMAAGSASALFLWSLDRITQTRWNHPWLLFLLPLAGLVMVWMYQRLGKKAERGTNLILDEIHQPGEGVPLRLAPLVLITTLLTHLCGGSAGREGTALQMGGGLAGGFIRGFHIQERHHRLLLQAGMAAGFSSVFGTPLAGAVFSLEVLTLGRIRHDYLIPCLWAALIGDVTCSAWGIHHHHYTVAALTPSVHWGFGTLDLLLLAKCLVAGVAFGWAARLFMEMTHGIQHLYQRYVPFPVLRPMLGGVIIIGLTLLLGTRAYLGLSVTSPNPGDVSLLSCFQSGGATWNSWFWKLVFTAITLGSGFKGGEVTPLFFIGAALGNTLSSILEVPTDFLAAMGFVAVFAGASNTPLACTLMGIELFGSGPAAYWAVGCGIAYLFSGQASIYGSQRVDSHKIAGDPLPPGTSMADLHGRKTSAGTMPLKEK